MIAPRPSDDCTTHDAEFGDLLRCHRSRSGFSQEALAERAAMSAAAIGALERGARRTPYPQTIWRIAEALELSDDARVRLQHAAERARERRRVRTPSRPLASGHSLPIPLTSFIERPEIEHLTRLTERNRLVTIVGPGGIGKTRSAIEVVARRETAANEHRGFLDLSDVTDQDAIVARLAGLVGVRERIKTATLDDVVRALPTEHVALVLDTCEHVIDDVARVVAQLATSCPKLSVLITSREPLGLSSEVVFRLPPLPTPVGEIGTLAQARSYAALDLFLTRAEAAAPQLVFSDGHARLIARICDRLDGIPLAIELATARLPVLGLEGLATHVFDAVGFAANRDRPHRQRTMEATIAWSYGLLSEAERSLLRRVAIFAETFTLDAAEQVCADDRLPATGIEDLLARLTHKSLLDVCPRERSPRYSLLEATRAFASRRLAESGEAEIIAHRHARWSIRVADTSAACESARTGERRYAAGSDGDASGAARKRTASSLQRSGDGL